MEGLQELLNNAPLAWELLFEAAGERNWGGGTFWKGEVIEYAALMYLKSHCTDWTAKDKDVIENFLRRQFAVLVKGKYIVKPTVFSWGCYLFNGDLPHKKDQLAIGFCDAGIALPTVRRQETANIIIRDDDLVLSLKQLYDYRCCLCQMQLQISETEYYCEVHHLKPLGIPHNGADIISNMMVLCPNHHKLFDRGVPDWQENGEIKVNGKVFTPIFRHQIDERFISYYKKFISL